MPMPLEKYKRDLEDEEFIADSAQEKAVRALQNLYDALTEPADQKVNYLEKFKSLLKIKSAEQIVGLYFWGGVGRGKTYLVDCFSNACLLIISCEYIFIVLCRMCIKNLNYWAM